MKPHLLQNNLSALTTASQQIKQNNQTTGNNVNNTLQDEASAANPDQNANQDQKKARHDQLQLSKAAQAYLNNGGIQGEAQPEIQDTGIQSISASPVKNSTPTNNTDLNTQALEFRGLTQASQTRGLTGDEDQRLNDISNNFAAIGASNKDILTLADKNLQDLQTQASDLVQSAQTNQITGDQFLKLTQINSALNKANGFGVAGNSTQTPNDASGLSQKFNAIVTQNSDKTLSQNDLANLSQISAQLSNIQGYRLNVNDSIGPDGLVV